MKYYISKPKSHALDSKLISGIKRIDSEAFIVDKMEAADICVFQRDWTKSKVCVKEHRIATEKQIKCKEGYLYTDKFYAKVSKRLERGFLIKKCKYPKEVCVNKTALDGNTYCMATSCSLKEKESKQTNADRIRGMSDEELAEWIAGIHHYSEDGEDIVRINNVHLHDSKDSILEWIQDVNDY